MSPASSTSRRSCGPRLVHGHRREGARRAGHHRSSGRSSRRASATRLAHAVGAPRHLSSRSRTPSHVWNSVVDVAARALAGDRVEAQRDSRSCATTADHTTGMTCPSLISRRQVADGDPVLQSETFEAQPHAQREDVGPAGAEAVADAQEQGRLLPRRRRLREVALQTAADELVRQALLAGARILGGAHRRGRSVAPANSAGMPRPRSAATTCRPRVPPTVPKSTLVPLATRTLLCRRVDVARQPLADRPATARRPAARYPSTACRNACTRVT